MKVTIIFKKPYVDVERQGMSICATFVPTGSYIDSPVFLNGVPAVAGADGAEGYKGYGKSVYATNVWGWGKLAGLAPMQTSTQQFAWFERAAVVAAAANKAAIKAANEAVKGKTADEAITAYKTAYDTTFEAENIGVTFEIDEIKDRLYWEQMADAMKCVADVTLTSSEEKEPEEETKPAGPSDAPKEE